MLELAVVTAYRYDDLSHHLKIFYNNGLAELYHPVPKAIYHSLIRRQDKAQFIHKYLEYNVHFTRIIMQ
jgi:hypothetical protein